jgi:hypothetical protein
LTIDAELPLGTQSVEGQLSNVPDPLADARTDPMVNWVWGTMAPLVFTVTLKKLNPTEPFAVAADPMQANVPVSAVRHKTVFNIVFKIFSSGQLAWS